MIVLFRTWTRTPLVLTALLSVSEGQDFRDCLAHVACPITIVNICILFYCTALHISVKEAHHN